MDSLTDIIERFIDFTAWEMTKPKAYGPFHLIFTFVGLAVLMFMAWKLRNISERGNKILLISVSVFLMVTELYNKMAEQMLDNPSLYDSYMSNYNVFYEMMDNDELNKQQYDIVDGRWPKASSGGCYYR